MNPTDTRLKELGIILPAVPAPAANYVPFVRTGSLIFVSGQVSLDTKGVLGQDLDIEAGKTAARQCAVNVLAVLNSAIGGDWAKVKRVVRVGGFVNAAPGFTQHPEVVNGASDLFVAVFGEAGKHARAAVGCSSLPRGVAVEVEAIFEVA